MIFYFMLKSKEFCGVLKRDFKVSKRLSSSFWCKPSFRPNRGFILESNNQLSSLNIFACHLTAFAYLLLRFMVRRGSKIYVWNISFWSRLIFYKLKGLLPFFSTQAVSFLKEYTYSKCKKGVYSKCQTINFWYALEDGRGSKYNSLKTKAIWRVMNFLQAWCTLLPI